MCQNPTRCFQGENKEDKNVVTSDGFLGMKTITPLTRLDDTTTPKLAILSFQLPYIPLLTLDMKDIRLHLG